MAAVHILIFGEMAGFKIVPFIPTHVKMIFFHGATKKSSTNQNAPICMKTTDIELFMNGSKNRYLQVICGKFQRHNPSLDK